jgi:hypothetical protein
MEEGDNNDKSHVLHLGMQRTYEERLRELIGFSLDKSEEIRHLYQRLGILLVKGNKALFFNRFLSNPCKMIDGSE